MDVAKMMNQEIREKKRTASGVHSKTGKRGYVGKMMFPNDLMSAKEKRQYRKSSKVEVYNMYDTMMSYEEFNKLPKADQAKALQAYREKFTLKDIFAHWKIGSNTLYKLIGDLDLPPLPRGNIKGGARKGAGRPKGTTKTEPQVVAPTIEEYPSINIEQLIEEEITKRFNKINKQATGFTTQITGTYSAEEIMNKLVKIAGFIEGETKKFKIELTITEQED